MTKPDKGISHSALVNGLVLTQLDVNTPMHGTSFQFLSFLNLSKNPPPKPNLINFLSTERQGTSIKLISYDLRQKSYWGLVSLQSL